MHDDEATDVELDGEDQEGTLPARQWWISVALVGRPLFQNEGLFHLTDTATYTGLQNQSYDKNSGKAKVRGAQY